MGEKSSKLNASQNKKQKEQLMAGFESISEEERGVVLLLIKAFVVNRKRQYFIPDHR